MPLNLAVVQDRIQTLCDCEVAFCKFHYSIIATLFESLEDVRYVISTMTNRLDGTLLTLSLGSIRTKSGDTASEEAAEKKT